ncbi:Uncharacterized protein QTN25_010360 [Entamoeba marina]
MFVFFCFVAFVCGENEIFYSEDDPNLIYSDGDLRWELNDTAFIGFTNYLLEGTYWLGGNLQRSDVLKLNGETDTSDMSYLCFDTYWEENVETIDIKVRILPYEFEGVDDVESGYTVTVNKNETVCVSLSNEMFDIECQTTVKYVSLQLDTKFEGKSLVYFNDIQFQEENEESSSLSEEDSNFKDDSGAMMHRISFLLLVLGIFILY